MQQFYVINMENKVIDLFFMVIRFIVIYVLILTLLLFGMSIATCTFICHIRIVRNNWFSLNLLYQFYLLI